MTTASSARARRYTLQSALGVTIVALILAAVFADTSGDAQARPHAAAAASKQAQQPESPTELDPAVYGHADQLRREVALTADDLAALDLTREQAEAVLAGLSDWCEQNHGRLAEAERVQLVAERELVELRRHIRTGHATALEAEGLAQKAEAVSQAHETRQALMTEGGMSAIQAGASDKAAAWQQASALAGSLPVELRHLSSMDASRLGALTREASRLGTRLKDQLSYNEALEAETIRGRIAQKRGLMRAAEAAVMPAPEPIGVGSNAGLE